MSRRPGGPLVALLAAVVLLVPTAAHAEKVVTHDAVGDVVTIVGDDLDQATPAPEQTGADVVRTVVAHGDNRVAITVHFRGLRRDPFHFTVVRVRTPRSTYDLLVERLGGKPITSLLSGEHDVDCRALKGHVDLRTDSVGVTLPATCLDSPRWVRVGVGAVAIESDPMDEEHVVVGADDAHRAGQVRDDLAWGPKVRRG
ncbi:exported hypothetical protein [metagenome]|uniref:Uncharacterized protein n=1 Tax=metagenome TaxID=256318 RepID=A0A2P2C382_9ZZZZ